MLTLLISVTRVSVYSSFFSSVLASFFALISCLVLKPLKPAWILVAACATSGSFKSISTVSPSVLVSPPSAGASSVLSASTESPASASLVSVPSVPESFWAFISWRVLNPLNPAWILTAAFSTSGSFKSMSTASLSSSAGFDSSSVFLASFFAFISFRVW